MFQVSGNASRTAPLMNGTPDEPFEALLRYLRDSRGFDFTGYKRTSLMRRVRHRMEHAGYSTFEEYLDVLQASSDEFAALFNTILINVTAFFRDPEAWDFVSSDVIPRLLAERGPDDPIRVWSAGCASGQEAYTLAMLLTEAMGADAFRQRVKIYATDIDEEALTDARTASYDAKAIESVPAELLGRYFEQVNGRYLFHKDLRRAVIFGRNDLVKDAPISRVDLLVCRNTLMYLNAETQRNVLGRLHFALAPQGTLFLGHAEMLLSHSDRFTPLSLKNRIFRKAVGSRSGADRYDPAATFFDRHGELPGLTTVRELAFRASPVAQLVVTGEDTIAMINQQAETVFGLSARDIGRLLRDLEVSYRPIELRTYLEQAKVDRRPARIPDVNGSVRARKPCGSRSTSTHSSTPKTAYSESRSYSSTSRRRGRCSTSWSRRIASSRPPMKSCSPPTRNSRRPTKNCSPRSRNSKPPTRNCSPPTKNSKP